MQKKELTLGIDIDGTVTDPFTFIPHLNDYFKKTLTNEQINTYDLTELYQITEQEYEEWHSKFGAIIYQNAPLAKNAKEILYELQHNYRLIYVTARSEEFRFPTMNWFENNQIPFDRVVMTGSYYKSEQVFKYGIDIFLEDNYDGAIHLSEKTSIPILLFDTPYNQGKLPKNVIRITSWLESKQFIDNYAKGKGYVQS